MRSQPEYQNLYDQVMQIWVEPEIKNRQRDGKLTEPVELCAVQVLLSIGGISKVRINDEVKGHFEARLKVPKQQGEMVFENEVEFAGIRNLLDDDANFAHITMIRIGEQWSISFSFLYDLKKAREVLTIGKEFLESAKQDILAGRLRSAANSLPVASEQIARAVLMLHPLDGNYRTSKKHRAINVSVNRYSHITDIIPKEYARGHNELVNEWAKARYDINFDMKVERLNEIATVVNALYTRTCSLIKSHTV